ncbi:MAG TPA: response regulator transcription factor [Trebonia sp.]|jgi:DNA-binding response OmpR family regulator|nr:response regulator transcription factor [Trebonia sp.]
MTEGLARPAASPGTPRSWRILVIDSDERGREDLRRNLERNGIEVQGAASGEAALEADDQADLILLDFELADLDGLEVCRAIRSVRDTPIIALTSRRSELDTVLGLQAGADDCLVKPYGLRELLARIEAVMRRARPRAARPRTIECGPLRIDASAREVIFNGQRVTLTRKEFDLLHMLAGRQGTVVTRRAIIREIWGDSWSQRTIDTHVSSLRGKLGNGTVIATVRGVGFMIPGGGPGDPPTAT